MTARLYDIPKNTGPFFTGHDPIPAGSIGMQLFGPMIVDSLSGSNGVGWTVGVSDRIHRDSIGSGVSQDGLFGPQIDGSACGFSDDSNATNNAYPPPTAPPRKERIGILDFASGQIVGQGVADVWQACGFEKARNGDSVRDFPTLQLGSATEVAVGEFDLNATTGNQSVTGIGFQPDFVLLLGAHPLVIEFGCAFEIGAFDADGNQFAVAARSVYGSGPTIIGGLLNRVTRMSRFRSDRCLLHIGADALFQPSTLDQAAEFVSMDADGFTINLTAAGRLGGQPARTCYLAARVVGGGAQVGVGFQDDAAIPTAFEPDGMLFFSNVADDEDQTTDAYMSYGMVDETDTQRGMWGGSTSGSLGGGPPPSSGAFSDDHAIYGPWATAQVVLGPDGADVFWDLSDLVARPFGWIAVFTTDVPTPVPTVETDPASASCDTATLCATVDPGGLDVDVYFQWGTTISYGNTVFAGTLSEAPDLICVEITGLGEGATYHYRAYIVTDDGCTYFGADETFTVGPCGERLRVISEPNATSFHTPDLTILSE